VRLLLDTHVLLWALATPARLPARVAAAVRDPESSAFVSAASIWEIAIKAALGKLSADVDEVVATLDAVGFEPLDVSLTHAAAVRRLPDHHRDPFDRMLVAQAIQDGLTIVTHDRAFAAYRVPVYW